MSALEILGSVIGGFIGLSMIAAAVIFYIGCRQFLKDRKQRVRYQAKDFVGVVGRGEIIPSSVTAEDLDELSAPVMDSLEK